MQNKNPIFCDYNDILEKYPTINELDFNDHKFYLLLKHLSKYSGPKSIGPGPSDIEELVNVIVTLHKNDWVVSDDNVHWQDYNWKTEDYENYRGDFTFDQEQFVNLIKFMCQFSPNGKSLGISGEEMIVSISWLSSNDCIIHKTNMAIHETLTSLGEDLAEHFRDAPYNGSTVSPYYEPPTP